jgi:apolipoprotein N-acyltransferase
MPSVLMRALCGLLSGWMLALAFPLSLPPLRLPEPIGLVPLALPGAAPGAGYTQLWWLAFIALIPLLESARLSPNGRQAFFWGYFTGVVWLSGHFIWLGSFGVAPVVLLVLYFALPVGLFTWLAHLIYRRGGTGLAVWGLAALWTGIEFARAFGMWAYPWNLLGYSQVNQLEFIQSADIGGVYLLSFLIALSNTALLALLSSTGAFRPRLGHALVAAALSCSTWAMAPGAWRPSAPTRRPCRTRSP